MSIEQTQICPEKKSSIQEFLVLLKELQRIDQEFPLQYAVCLSIIFLHEGLSLTHLSEKTNLSISTISRIISALSKDKPKGRAYELVDVQIDENEKRKKKIFLSARGHRIMGDIAKLMK